MTSLSQALSYSEQKKFVLEKPPTPLPPSRLEGLQNAAFDQNPELRALRAEDEAAHRSFDAACAANYPSVSAVDYAGATPMRDTSAINPNHSAAGIVIDIPIFTGGRLGATSQKAEFQAMQRNVTYMNSKTKSRVICGSHGTEHRLLIKILPS